MQAQLYHRSHCMLGEGPIWDFRKSELLWVDIDKCQLSFLGTDQDTAEIFEFDQKIGFAALSSQDDYIVGLADGIYRWNRGNQELQPLHRPELDKPNNRFNDGKCAPDGSVWCGTMDLDQKPYQGALYRLDASGELTKMLDAVSISNGLAWNTELGKMYYIDSPTRSVFTFEYHPGSGEMGKLTDKFVIPPEMGFPDGMTIDEDGMLWIAHWDGACIAKWHPVTGQLITKITLPAPRVTSCTFGEGEKTTLFVTTARTGLDEHQLTQYPLSGSVFSIDTNSVGIFPSIYRGEE